MKLGVSEAGKFGLLLGSLLLISKLLLLFFQLVDLLLLSFSHFPIGRLACAWFEYQVARFWDPFGDRHSLI